MLRVSVFGIGYVGAVTSACISDSGFKVTAVDVSPGKVNAINSGTSPIVEPGLPELLRGGVERGLLRATTSAEDAIANSDLSIICVGTPSLPNGDLDLTYVQSVAEEIGAALAQKEEFHSIVMRSTMLPGSMHKVVIPALERTSGKRAGIDFGVAYYPEFLREASAIADYRNPSVIVLGIMDDLSLAWLREINANLAAPEVVVDVPTAEAIKYANNSWHAVKITFANEIGNIAQAAGVDGHKVMEAVCADKRLNISPAYMIPGMAYGGSCLPKDLRALRYKARSLDVGTPLLDALAESNSTQIGRAFNLITRSGKRKVGMLGLSFKAGTDDLRESPLVEIAERLHGKGYDLRIYDKNVRHASLTGANLSYIGTHLPHLADLMVDSIDQIDEHAEVLVVGNSDPMFHEIVLKAKPHQTIVDFVRVDKDVRTDGGQYVGLCW
jgi:GDP-mannose 6-dehydrogenase